MSLRERQGGLYYDHQELPRVGQREDGLFRNSEHDNKVIQNLSLIKLVVLLYYLIGLVLSRRHYFDEKEQLDSNS